MLWMGESVKSICKFAPPLLLWGTLNMEWYLGYKEFGLRRYDTGPVQVVRVEETQKDHDHLVAFLDRERVTRWGIGTKSQACLIRL